jgi:hypothetical protein
LVNKAVARDVAKIFTKLFPNSTEPINRSLSSVIDNALAAPRDPLSAWVWSLPLEAAVKAVSLPEKKADNNKRINMADIVSQKA